MGETTCSATLLDTPSGRHVITARHCVPQDITQYTVEFDAPTAANDPPIVHTPLGVHIHPVAVDYTQGHIPYDVAIVELTQPVPNSGPNAIERYGIYTGNNELGQILTKVGFGDTGTGANGDDLSIPRGTKRAGQNKYEVLFEQISQDLVIGEGQLPGLPPGSLLVYDFDSGMAQNDTFGLYLGSAFNDTGLGSDEVLQRGGDSGGPSFIGTNPPLIAGTTTFTRSPDLSDTEPMLSGSFGEIGVDVRMSSVQCWINNITASPPLLDEAPRVKKVTVGSTLNDHADFDIETKWINAPGFAKAQQIASVPVGLPNTIAITFSEDVVVSEDDLELVAINQDPQIEYHDDDDNTFAYSSTTNTATWTFNTPLTKDLSGEFIWNQLELTLTSAITEQVNTDPGALKRLDGEWFNPESVNDPNFSLFPSGNGCQDDVGDSFKFYLTAIHTDFSRDNVVDTSDFNNWNANKFTNPVDNHFVRGDANSDNSVDVADFNLWNETKFLVDLTVWGGSQQQSASSGGGSLPVNAFFQEFDSLVDQHHVYQNGRINRSLSFFDWQQFTDDLDALFARWSL